MCSCFQITCFNFCLVRFTVQPTVDMRMCVCSNIFVIHSIQFLAYPLEWLLPFDALHKSSKLLWIFMTLFCSVSPVKSKWKSRIRKQQIPIFRKCENVSRKFGPEYPQAMQVSRFCRANSSCSLHWITICIWLQ